MALVISRSLYLSTIHCRCGIHRLDWTVGDLPIDLETFRAMFITLRLYINLFDRTAWSTDVTPQLWQLPNMLVHFGDLPYFDSVIWSDIFNESDGHSIIAGAVSPSASDILYALVWRTAWLVYHLIDSVGRHTTAPTSYNVSYKR